MLRIAGNEVRPRHRGELRVVVMATRPAGLGQARAYLAADLLRRYAERSRLAPSVIDFSPDGEAGLLGFDGDAAGTLSRWRGQVAKWAESPSGAISRPHAEAIAAAVDDGLDTAAALRVLADLEADGGVPDGAKFETFAAADRLFGLDLARDIGK
ncbi:MAG TPA: hypothetical protein VG164_06180 [Trebonia sp.]|nr:hypothetical protein [Trebonia sp.]